MEDIKETKTKKIIKFLLDHIMIISAIIFLCVLLFSSCSTAKAADIGADYDDFLTVQCEKYNINYSEISSYLQNYPYIISFDCGTHFIALFIKDYSNSITNYSFPCFFSFGSNLSNYISDMKVTTQFSVRSEPEIAVSSANSSYECLYLTITSGSYNLQRLYNFTSGGSNNTQNSNYFAFKTYYAYPSSSGSQRLAYKSFSYTWYYYKILAGSDIYTNTDTYIGRYYANLYKLTPNIGHSYTEDSRLRMYITNAIGGPRLNVNVVDFAKSFPYPDQTVLQPKEITLTIETDGVESLYTLDSSTAIWASKYWATVPVSDIAELDGHDVVKITKVQFSMYDSFANMTEDFYIATDFALKDTTEEINPATILPPGDIYEDAKSTAQIDLLVQTLEANGSGSVYGDFTFQSSIPVLPSWSDEIYTDLTRMEDTSSAFADHWYDHYPWSFGDIQINPVEYINEFCDGYASVYDVIIFRVYGWMLDASFSTDDPTIGSYSTGIKGYIVLYTNKFYNHSTSLTSLDILTVLQNDANQQKSNWSWLVSKLNDFESKSLEAMNADLRVERESRDWLKSIWNQIDNLDMPFYDDSDLLDKLDLIISELDEIAGFFTGESGEGYNRFTEWLEKIENDGEITPHEWANDIFNYVTGLYHSLSDGTSYYTNDITDYINYVNHDGNSDPGNYFFAMYEGTYDPHNYYGWTGGTNE